MDRTVSKGLLLGALLAGCHKPAPKGVFLYTAEEAGGRESKLPASFKAALEAAGYEAVDVQDERLAYFCGPTERCPWTEGNLGGPVPSGFPSRAVAALREGLAACNAPIPDGSGRYADAFVCGNQVQAMLWQGFLEERHAAAYAHLFYSHHHSAELVLHGRRTAAPTEHEVRLPKGADPAGLQAVIAAFEQEQPK